LRHKGAAINKETDAFAQFDAVALLVRTIAIYGFLLCKRDWRLGRTIRKGRGCKYTQKQQAHLRSLSQSRGLTKRRASGMAEE